MSLKELYPEFDDPDVVGQAEYRALYACLQNALDSLPGDNVASPRLRDDLVLGCLDELCSTAGGLAAEIRERLAQELDQEQQEHGKHRA